MKKGTFFANVYRVARKDKMNRGYKTLYGNRKFWRVRIESIIWLVELGFNATLTAKVIS